METSSTTTTNPPCLHRFEDDHASGLPFICTLDKGHAGEHAEDDGSGLRIAVRPEAIKSHAIDDAPSDASAQYVAQLVIETGRTFEELFELVPTFGLVGIESQSSSYVGCLGQNATSDLDDLSAGQLRQLAADAVKAAEWLEARA